MIGSQGLQRLDFDRCELLRPVSMKLRGIDVAYLPGALAVSKMLAHCGNVPPCLFRVCGKKRVSERINLGVPFREAFRQGL
jgi:hypothetical protein